MSTIPEPSREAKLHLLKLYCADKGTNVRINDTGVPVFTSTYFQPTLRYLPADDTSTSNSIAHILNCTKMQTKVDFIRTHLDKNGYVNYGRLGTAGDPVGPSNPRNRI